MSVFGPKQVEELIIGNAVAAEATVDTFDSSASDKEIKAVAADGGAAAEGKVFYFLQKTSGDAGKGLDIEFSDRIDPKKINKIILKQYAPEVQKAVSIEGFDGNIQSNTLYAVNIRLYNESGSLSTENFRVISGYYTTGAVAPTATVVRDGIVASLNAELKSRGDSEFVVTTGEAPTSITITGKYQPVVAGKDVGAQIQFDVTTKSVDEASGDNLGLLTVTEVSAANPGTGTGKYAVNLEWFTKGYKYSIYRDAAYPADFDEPYYASKSGIYNAIHIKYYSDRNSPGVEVQEKVLTILVEKATNDNAGNTPTNAVLADLRLFVDDTLVPADLNAVNPV